MTLKRKTKLCGDVGESVKSGSSPVPGEWDMHYDVDEYGGSPNWLQGCILNPSF
jgi:hypothetical protein